MNEYNVPFCVKFAACVCDGMNAGMIADDGCMRVLNVSDLVVVVCCYCCSALATAIKCRVSC